MFIIMPFSLHHLSKQIKSWFIIRVKTGIIWCMRREKQLTSLQPNFNRNSLCSFKEQRETLKDYFRSDLGAAPLARRDVKLREIFMQSCNFNQYLGGCIFVFLTRCFVYKQLIVLLPAILTYKLIKTSDHSKNSDSLTEHINVTW